MKHVYMLPSHDHVKVEGVVHWRVQKPYVVLLTHLTPAGGGLRQEPDVGR
jgi:hypothetical protein